MAYFHEISVTIGNNQPGERLSNSEIPCRSINGPTVYFGLLGYLEFGQQELEVVSSMRGAVTTEKKRVLGNSREWAITTRVSGQARLEARTVAGQVVDWMTLTFMDAGPAEGPYTTNPNEVAATRTTPTIAQVVSMLLASWPNLTQAGARTLAAQFAGETGWGKSCFNWNLGNVKSGPNDPHMYLSGIWEIFGDGPSQNLVKNSGGFAHLANAAEISKNGWSAPGAGQSTPVFYPPHPMCRFRSFASLQEGAQRWVHRYQNMARANNDFLTAVNAGDTDATAHALKQVGYYQATEASYAAIMASAKAQIDRTLGPLTGGH